MTSRIMAIATRSRIDENAPRKRSSLRPPWKTRADKKAGCPACASLLPSRMPTSEAATGCKINRKRPGPESRATMSSKKRCVNRYRSPVCTSLTIAPGTADKRIVKARTIRIELREIEIFISLRLVIDYGTFAGRKDSSQTFIAYLAKLTVTSYSCRGLGWSTSDRLKPCLNCEPG